jgi:serine/threonine protein phosphatase PrpC
MNPDPLSDTVEMFPPNVPGAPPITAVSIDIGAGTHPGKVRPNNEDHFHVARFGRYLHTLRSSLPGSQVPLSLDESGYVFAVADGMGGMAAGELASRLAITFLIESGLNTPDWIFGRNEPFISAVLARCASRFREVNDAVLERASAGSRLRGMGTTLTAALSLGADLIVAHVGDSPVFVSRRDGLFRLTRDHTVGEELTRRGVDDTGHFRHVLTHAIGIPGTGGKPDILRHGLADGDRLLLCTDGLTNMVDDEAIAHELRRETSAEDMARALIALALDRGGKDNVTVVVAAYRITQGAPAPGDPAR